MRFACCWNNVYSLSALEQLTLTRFELIWAFLAFLLPALPLNVEFFSLALLMSFPDFEDVDDGDPGDGNNGNHEDRGEGLDVEGGGERDDVRSEDNLLNNILRISDIP